MLKMFGLVLYAGNTVYYSTGKYIPVLFVFVMTFGRSVVSSTNKIDCHNITEICVKNQNPNLILFVDKSIIYNLLSSPPLNGGGVVCPYCFL